MKEFTRFEKSDEFRKNKEDSVELLSGKFFKVYLMANGQILFHPSDGDFIAVALDPEELRKIIQKAEEGQGQSN